MKRTILIVAALAVGFCGAFQAAQALSTACARAVARSVQDGQARGDVVPLIESGLSSVEIMGRIDAVGVGALIVQIDNYDDPDTPPGDRRVPHFGQVTVNGQAFPMRKTVDHGLVVAIPADALHWPDYLGGAPDDVSVAVWDVTGAEICAMDVRGARSQ